MPADDFHDFEAKVFGLLEGKLGNMTDDQEIFEQMERIAKTINPAATQDQIQQMVKDSKNFDPIDKYLSSEEIEDIMVNNINNIYLYKSGAGYAKAPESVKSRQELSMFVRKLRMYTTSDTANKHIFDVHLPNGSRANIVDSPLGSDVTIRNFKKHALSIIDLVNSGELSYALAGRLWLYAEGMKVRPANLLIGGAPGSGKSTLLNAMFSFFRPEQRIVVVEDTYELNTVTQENCVRLETSPEMDLQDLLKNVLRMRPDMIIVGEVRGAEAKDMMSAMNIGKIAMSTIHASTSRDVITRLERSPMSIDTNSIPLVDAIVVVSQINEDNKYVRKVTQVSEISGIETRVLLSDLFSYDYKTRKGSQILPSVTYRDNLAKLTGHSPSQVLEEEARRAKILEKLNESGMRDVKSINEFCREYYDNAERALAKLGLQSLGTLSY